MTDTASPGHLPPELAELTSMSHGDVKKSWRSVLDKAAVAPVVMTNHGRAMAVVLSPQEYIALVRNAQQVEDPLDALTRRFNERLGSLAAAGAADRLRALNGSAPAEMGRAAETPLLSG